MAQKGICSIYLKDRGVNYVRLRLWNDPQKSGGYNDKEDVIAFGRTGESKRHEDAAGFPLF